MNIAFPAFLLFLLLVPGFIFRATFRSLEGARLDAGPFAASSIKIVLCAFTLDLFVWGLVEWITPYTVQWDALLGLLASGEKSTESHKAIRLVAARPFVHVGYFIAVYAMAAGSGWALRVLCTRYKWDQREKFLAPLLRLGNEWYYLFKGYDEAKGPDVIVISAIVNLDEPYLYRGVLEAFYFAEDGALDRLVLSATSRRKISQDKHHPGANNPAFYPIEGDFFILRYAETTTLNVFYLTTEVVRAIARNTKQQSA